MVQIPALVPQEVCVVACVRNIKKTNRTNKPTVVPDHTLVIPKVQNYLLFFLEGAALSQKTA